MEQKRICNEICRKFKVKRPLSGNRYAAGQGRCQTCDVWIDHRGAHTMDGSPAAGDSEGWFCNCCNYRVRRLPRSRIYKEKMRVRTDRARPKPRGAGRIDLDYFDNNRARMLRELGEAIATGNTENSREDFTTHVLARVNVGHLEAEFEAGIGKIIALALDDRPNKASLIAEFEAVRAEIGRVPTKQDIGSYSSFDASQYEEEFESWEHMLERLGYDPWYRDAGFARKTRDGA